MSKVDQWCDVGWRDGMVVSARSVYQAVETTDWTTPVPTDFLRDLRLWVRPSGELLVIGQGGEGNAWVVTRTSCDSLGPTYGNCSVAWGPGGVPFVVRSGTHYTAGGDTHTWANTTQGIREVLADGSVIRGDDNLVLTMIQGHPFYKRTPKDGFIVGQNGTSIGVLHVASGAYFTCPPGQTLSVAEGIHFSVWKDSRIAIAALTDHGAYVEDFAVGDIDKTTNDVNRLTTVALVRSGFQTPLGDRHAEFLLKLARSLQVAGDTGAGLLKKTGGTTIQLPDGTTVAQDNITYPDGSGRDVLGDGEGAATPQWGDRGPGDPARYYKVPLDGPVDPPVDPVKPFDPKPLLDQIDALRASVALLGASRDVHQSRLDAMGSSILDLEDQVHELEHTPKLPWKVQGGVNVLETGRTFGHTHIIKESK